MLWIVFIYTNYINLSTHVKKKINIMMFPAGCRLLINITIGPRRTLLFLILL